MRAYGFSTVGNSRNRPSALCPISYSAQERVCPRIGWLLTSCQGPGYRPRLMPALVTGTWGKCWCGSVHHAVERVAGSGSPKQEGPYNGSIAYRMRSPHR
jgi:hypothetical protein